MIGCLLDAFTRVDRSTDVCADMCDHFDTATMVHTNAVDEVSVPMMRG